MAKEREWTLSRGVQPPVSFVGSLLHHHDGIAGISLWQAFAIRGRWHVLSLFRTREGRFVIYITFRSRVPGELDNREVFWCDQAEGIPTILVQYQQLAFPVIAQRMLSEPAKRQRDAVELLARFQRQAADLLARLPRTAHQVG